MTEPKEALNTVRNDMRQYFLDQHIGTIIYNKYGLVDEIAVAALDEIDRLRKALEDAEQTSKKWEKAFENADRQYLKQEKLSADLRRENERLKEEGSVMLRQATKHITDENKLRKALEFYADPKTYDADHLDKFGYIIIDSDSGKIARQALEPAKGEDERE